MESDPVVLVDRVTWNFFAGEVWTLLTAPTAAYATYGSWVTRIGGEQALICHYKTRDGAHDGHAVLLAKLRERGTVW